MFVARLEHMPIGELMTAQDVLGLLNDCDFLAWRDAHAVAAPVAQPELWQPIETAPKDGTPIFGWCVHAADPYFLDDGKRLTLYGSHTEGLGHVQDGPNVVVWGGAFDDSTWEAPGAKLPDWWFQHGSDFEVTANPTHWMPLPAAPADGAPVAQPVAWRCFHCDETFTDREQAALHFGRSEQEQAFCTIDPAHFRWMEAQHRRNVDDDSEALRTVRSLASEHEQLRREAEELGYARGIRDAKRHPEELGLIAAPAERGESKLLVTEADCEDQGVSDVREGCNNWPCYRTPLVKGRLGWRCPKCGGCY